MPLTADPVSKLAHVHLMILDGSEQATNLLKNIFTELGFMNIHVAKDGYEGIQLMKRTVVHMIFTDWELRVRRQSVLDGSGKGKELPPLSGADFVKRLRRSPRSPNPFVPVVMVVNEASGERATNARAAGINEIIVKPLKASELCRQIMNLIDDRRYFITAPDYRGPCRRQAMLSLPPGIQERRIREVRLVRREETMRGRA
jgi:CheY-like chemotaxis protein